MYYFVDFLQYFPFSAGTKRKFQQAENVCQAFHPGDLSLTLVYILKDLLLETLSI